MARLHAMVGEALGEDAEDADPGQVLIGIETDRGPVGGRADRGRVHGARDQPAAGIPVPEAALT
jgi:hypothetical protein